MWTFPKRHPRHGVLLLIVLALLVLFGLLTLTFVLIAGHHYRGARAKQNLADEQATDPALLIDEGIDQILRGPKDNQVASVLKFHSLLEDKYGNQTVQGQILASPVSPPIPFQQNVVLCAGGKIVEIRVQLLDASGNPLANFTPLDYVGRVITFTTGVSQGTSRRIIGYNNDRQALQISLGDWVTMKGKDNQPGTVNVDDDGDNTKDNDYELGWAKSDDQLRAYDQFLINGPDFAGTGFGYNATTDQDDAVFSARPQALLPNLAAYLSPFGAAPDPTTGGANEDWDAPDYQNMLLAKVNDDGTVPLPSLHRPSLVRYWIRVTNNPSPMPSTPADWLTQFNSLPDDLKRQIVLRPLKINNGHPKFITGDNSIPDNFNPAWDGVPAGSSPEWDVDNDRDGHPDSIWVDLGAAPVNYEGKLYKPLYAILCMDLDGRLNVNTHGAFAQAPSTASNYYQNVSAPTRNGVASCFAANATFGGSPLSNALTRTIGFGPADINLGPLFGDGNLVGNNALLTAYRNLLNRRYGDTDADRVPGIKGPDPLAQNIQSQYFNPVWRAAPFLSAAATWKYDYWGYWTDWSSYAPNAYGSPIDFQAKGAIGLDMRGQPLYADMSVKGEDEDHPYEVDLLRTSDADNVFSVAELEYFLRQHDSDADQLPPALRDLFNGLTHPNLARELTTQSWDVPTPGMRLSADLRTCLQTTWGSVSTDTQTAIRNRLKGSFNPAAPNANLVDLLIARLANGLDAKYTAPADKQQIPQMIARLLPRLLPIELGLGLKINLNHPFGDGMDNNGNRIVDEPARLYRSGSSFLVDPSHCGELVYTKGTTTYSEAMPQYDAKGNSLVNGYLNLVNGVDVNGDGTVNAVDQALARQLYARQLYVLMLLLTNYQVANPNNITQTERDEARLIAQWAVNVVDYQDRDSIMTPFEYDICPFTDKVTGGSGSTWNVDGGIDEDPSNIASDDGKPYRGLVWGCERPELLITETLAFHDRATKDDKIAAGDDYAYSPSGTADLDFDQRVRPRGSLFVEIYNPWSYEDGPSGELHDFTSGGVDLTRVAPGTRSPVWRLAIYDDPNKTIDAENPPRPERSVYMADLATVGGIDIPAAQDGLQHYPSHPLTAALKPGQYLVLGPGDNDMPEGSETTTFLGLATGATKPDVDTTRHLTLPPFTAAGAFDVFLNRSTTASDLHGLRNPVVRINTPLGVAIDKARISSGQQAATGNLRLSVSEPLGGYPAKDPNGDDFDKVNQVYTQPFGSPLDFTYNATLWPKLSQNGIYIGFRIIHLQRLANPLLAWNEYSNPYRTVDVMMVDLTTFNGTPQDPAHTGPEPLMPPVTAIAPDIIEGSTNYFCSRQRGANNGSAPTVLNNLWTQERLVDRAHSVLLPPKPSGVTCSDYDELTSVVSNQVFNPGLHHTLGYLNWYLNAGGSTPADAAKPADSSFGPLSIGAPRYKPFPWLRWANRPFVSPGELLEVPTLGSGGLLAHPSDVATTTFPFGKTFAVVSGTPKPFENEGDGFGYLLNFAFSGTSGSFNGASGCQPGKLSRILDLVEVPSPFPQQNEQADAAVMAANGGHTFYPPFNRIPNFRKPGLVNLNTISSPAVWQGVLNYLDDPSTTYTPIPYRWAELVNSRQGFGSYDATQFPTEYANPFRSAASADLRPTLASGANYQAPHGPIDATLLRAIPTGTGDQPLFEYQSVHAVNDTNRNPYFRYQVLERLSNLVTTRSNLYAVWVTMGFFEVENVAPTALCPDGLQLGLEATAADLGRHRSFYIIDRTIPVGFRRGQQLNVDKAVILRRTIE